MNYMNLPDDVFLKVHRDTTMDLHGHKSFAVRFTFTGPGLKHSLMYWCFTMGKPGLIASEVIQKTMRSFRSLD